MHIQQKLLGVEGEVYTAVNDPDSLLGNHPAILEHPDLFELIEGDEPENAQHLNYTG